MNQHRSFVAGALAQGLPSLTNFMAAMWLIKQTSFISFGFYSLLFAISGLIVALQRPLVSLPMSVFATRRHVADHYADFYTFHLVTLVLGVVVSLIIAFIMKAPTLAFVAYVFTQQLREFVKTYQFSVHDRSAAMRYELAASLIFFSVFAWFQLYHRVDVASTLLSSAAGAAVFLLPWIRSRAALQKKRRRRFRWKRYLYIWRDVRWSVAGALANEATTRSYNYIVAILGGFELLGLINFVRQLYAPIQLISNAWSQISLPVQREHYVHNRAASARKLRLMARLGFLIITLGWSLALYLAMPLMQSWKSELDTPLLPVLLVLWCAYYIVDSQVILYSVEFHLRRQFHYLFKTGAICAVLTLLLSIPVVLWLSEPWLVAVSTLLNAGLLVIYFANLVHEEAMANFAASRH
ncbi:hypothetical protein [Granulosicoccus antarcticus]|uniref:Polysaccharide biosynthesis protein C-terminal domain-containing protein n=1 Tax=Granulosicoccus antarcticus IMCC3135 TaxID=1192854 RepID=A0A2Z2NI44_9GAMM|nr:hypothetical protein [Granulosicoccus antarcticus]ASJ70992.1 hypothetical protein IMCC3135_04395 [Granulosicoccus antarcticus IMCC3135]